VATQAHPDLQESTAKQNSTVCILGVNKIAPNFVTLVVTCIYIYIYVVRLFKDLTARHIYVVRRLRVKLYLVLKVSQTGRDFRTRFNEHKRSFMHDKTSKYALHLLEHSHTLGSMHNVMQIIQLQKKDIHLDTIERFHIHREAATNNHLNDDHSLSTNRIFDTILRDLQNEVQ
jgi:hypothetical protein